MTREKQNKPNPEEFGTDFAPSPKIHKGGGKSPNTPNRGEKRRFGAAGIVNVILSNLVLQFLLSRDEVTVVAATLTSQAINFCFGYAIYGKIVFKARGLRHRRPLLRYLILMTALWLLNTAGIEAGEYLQINRNFAAAAMIPCLAVISYLTQKNWTFKQ